MSDTKTKARGKAVDVYPKLSERVVRAAERLERLRRVNPDSYRHILALIDVIR